MASVNISKSTILDGKFSFYDLTRPLILFCKFLGIFFPVSNLKKGSHKNVRFVLKSPYGLIGFVTTSLQILCMFLTFFHMFLHGLNTRNYYKYARYFGGATISVLLFLLARSWPRLLSKVAAIEANLPRNGSNEKNVPVICYLTVATVIGCTLVDLILYIIFSVRMAAACGLGSTLLESYYYYTVPWIAKYIPYHPVIAIGMQIVNIQTSLIIAVADSIIISVSFYLTSRFRDLNNSVVYYKDKFPGVWGIVRVHYSRLVRLVEILDRAVSPFIVVSFGVKLSIICVHLFNILKKDSAYKVLTCNPEKIREILNSVLRIGYLVFAIGETIGRSLLTSLVGAMVHNTARESISMMYEVPTRCFNAEAQRFLDQMYTNKVALSGHHFFYLTQNMIRSMVLTIITYELVLMQFSEA